MFASEINEDDSRVDDQARVIFVCLFIFVLISCSQGNVADDITITINAGEYNITKDNNGFYAIEMEESSPLFIPGNPMLPCKKINVLLPTDANDSSLELEVISAKTQILAGVYEIKPSPSISSYENHSTKNDSDKYVLKQDFENTLLNNRNNSVYGADTNYPKNFVMLLPPSQMRKWKFVSVNFVPFQYNPAQKKLTLIENVTIKISYIQKRLPTALVHSFAADTVMDDLAPHIFLNYNEASNWYAKPAKLTNEDFEKPN